MKKDELTKDTAHIVESVHFFVYCKKVNTFYNVGCIQGTREITRLDLTIQPLIQDILSQIIDSSPGFPERFRDSSCMKFPFKQNKKCYLM